VSTDPHVLHREIAARLAATSPAQLRVYVLARLPRFVDRLRFNEAVEEAPASDLAAIAARFLATIAPPPNMGTPTTPALAAEDDVQPSPESLRVPAHPASVRPPASQPYTLVDLSRRG
jgi:hypothetical protein